MITERYVQEYIKRYQLPVDGMTYQWDVIRKPQQPDIFFQLFTPPKIDRTVLFLHGYFDHAATNAAFIEYLLNKDIRVAVFDLPGHGLSEGKRHEISSFQTYQVSLHEVLAYLKSLNITELAAIGHSTGAAILAEYVLLNGQSFQKLSLISPLLRTSQWWTSKYAAPLIHMFSNELPRKFKAGAVEEEFLHRLKNDPLQGKAVYLNWVSALVKWEKKFNGYTGSFQPVQILQGTKDTTVSWRQNMLLYKKLFPAAEQILIDNGRHHLLNEKPSLKDLTFHLLLQYHLKSS
ncbi:alpha/beta hydrolase [Alteribacillus sp. HJP-4]|uniref:alpha/beta hydrolase n=1 Tax=Alteribacillus sp. HJP-4 TaxID=2775394 RepID=UPI0035CD1A46